MKKIIVLLLMISVFTLSCDKNDSGDKPRITEENLKNIEKKQKEKQAEAKTEKTTENK